MLCIQGLRTAAAKDFPDDTISAATMACGGDRTIPDTAAPLPPAGDVLGDLMRDETVVGVLKAVAVVTLILCCCCWHYDLLCFENSYRWVSPELHFR